MPDPAKKDPLAELKATLPAQFSDDEQSDPGEGGGDETEGSGGLDDDIEEQQEQGDKSGDVDKDDDSDGLDADDDAEKAEVAEKKPADEGKKPEVKSEDEKLLDGETLTKLSGGEYISKKSFLKRIKKEAEGKKALQAQLDAAKPLLERKAEFEEFEKNKKVYDDQNSFIAALTPVLNQDPFLAQMLRDKMSGKPTNWAEMTQHLKPYLAPFWEGVEIVEPDPTEKALQIAQETKERMQKWEQDQQKTQQERQKQQQAQERQQQHLANFSAQEKNVWLKHKAYANQPVFADMLLSKAEVKQAELDAQGKGQVVNLEQVADELFGQLSAIEAKKRQERQVARDRAKLAGGERSGGVPGIPVKKPTAQEEAVNPRQQVKADILAAFGESFG